MEFTDSVLVRFDCFSVKNLFCFIKFAFFMLVKFGCFF